MSYRTVNPATKTNEFFTKQPRLAARRESSLAVRDHSAAIKR
jgi:hypothetical protein